jgi:Flp pilus assembly protein TadG
MNRWRAHGEGGQVTAFVVVFAIALVALAGLVFDGGVVMAAKRRALNEAQAAARAGAQALDVDRYRLDGTYTLDTQKARNLAMAYLVQTGHTTGATVNVSGTQVDVSVQWDETTNMLAVAGIKSVHVDGSGSARNARGVVVEE